MKEELANKILDALSDAKLGMTILEVAEKTSLNRATVAKYLEVLEAKGEVISKKIGVYRLWLSRQAIERERTKTQGMFGNAFLKALSTNVKITPELAQRIGAKIGELLAPRYARTPIKIKSMQDLLELIMLQCEVEENMKMAIIHSSINGGILRIFRPKDLDARNLDWIYHVEAAAWQHIFELLGEKGIKVHIKEITRNHCDIELEYKIF